MPIDEVTEFRKYYSRFLKWLPYMAKKRLKMNGSSPEWKNILAKFNTQVTDPMDKAWSKLIDDKKRLFQRDDNTRKKKVLENTKRYERSSICSYKCSYS